MTSHKQPRPSITFAMQKVEGSNPFSRFLIAEPKFRV
jgi:hypothetical protein